MNTAAYWNNYWQKRKDYGVNDFAKKAYDLIKTKDLKTLLDLGCGNGNDAIYFTSKGLKVTAMDIAENEIEKLKIKHKKIEGVAGKIEELNFKENSFDIVYAHLSLHYFDDKTTQRIFNKIYEILRKNGLFFIKCKSIKDPLFGQGEKIEENVYKKEHIRHFFTKEYMAEKLKKFKIISLKETAAVYDDYKSEFIEAIAEKV